MCRSFTCYIAVFRYHCSAEEDGLSWRGGGDRWLRIQVLHARNRSDRTRALKVQCTAWIQKTDWIPSFLEAIQGSVQLILYLYTGSVTQKKFLVPYQLQRVCTVEVFKNCVAPWVPVPVKNTLLFRDAEPVDFSSSGSKREKISAPAPLKKNPKKQLQLRLH